MSLSNEDLLGLQGPEVPEIPKKRRTMHKLTDELLLGPRGLPALHRALKKYKFHHAKRPAQRRDNYTNSHHFDNLTRLLHVYQVWGHDVYPQYKFKDFIPVLSRAMGTSQMRTYKRALMVGEPFEPIQVEAQTHETDVDIPPPTPSESAPKPVDDDPGLFLSDDELYTPAGKQPSDQPAAANDDEDVLSDEMELAREFGF
ncbi:hypothetical protein OGAPHI_003026 [Ogataea philodendri]|uniref:Chromosome segregation in meiosis protein n=1 Tax=Ogataea philodendri TaxID=1378263 RepID=A0A9P8P9Q8_9ASCO|nr:uncharacterized protein OGAPHI_003026 [Ogataea philodendri]KAH3667377.1 hypothetical protein OGAPHI_003026 [Ogataea philodendri]